jgi:hypothetical protein
MSSIPLWTSTQFHNWKMDFARFTASHQAFEVRAIHNAEQETFCQNHCELQNYACVIENLIASCSPPVPNQQLIATAANAAH